MKVTVKRVQLEKALRQYPENIHLDHDVYIPESLDIEVDWKDIKKAVFEQWERMMMKVRLPDEA